MKRWLKFAPALLALAAALPAWACDGITATDAWIAQAPPGATVLAGYVSFGNDSGKAVKLHAGSSADFGSVDFHRSYVVNGVEKMDMLDDLPVAAHAQVKLAPGGLHLMLFQPRRALKAGDTVTLRFGCGATQPMAVVFTVKPLP